MQLSLGDPGWKLFLLLLGLCKVLFIATSAPDYPGCLCEGGAGSLGSLTWGVWRTTCHTEYLSLPLSGGSCWLKSFVFQSTGVSCWFPQGHTRPEIKSWIFWTPASPSQGSRSSRGGLQPPHVPTLNVGCHSCDWGIGGAFWNLGPSMQLHSWDSHSLFCYLSYTHWQKLRYLYLTETLLEFFHSTGISPAKSLEKSQLGYTPHERGIFKLVRNWVLNQAKMPILDPQWCNNSGAEHKTTMFKLWHFDLSVCQKSRVTL